jgi:hypothetical protein
VTKRTKREQNKAGGTKREQTEAGGTKREHPNVKQNIHIATI